MTAQQETVPMDVFPNSNETPRPTDEQHQDYHNNEEQDVNVGNEHDNSNNRSTADVDDHDKQMAIMHAKYPPVFSFEEMEIPEEIIRALYSLDFMKPSKVQQHAVIPHKKGLDVVVQAHSGTGKTLAFALGAVCYVNKELNQPQVFVFCHTRELAQQTAKVFKDILQYSPITYYEMYGGGGRRLEDDRQALLQGKQIIIGTPGRIKHLMARKFLSTRYVSQVILDEADKMLDSNFLEDIVEICGGLELKSSVQMCLYSATMPKRVLAQIKEFMRPGHCYEYLYPPEKVALDGIKQYYHICKEPAEKLEVAMSLFGELSAQSVFIFCNKKEDAMIVCDEFNKNNFNCKAIHGNLEQSERNNIISEFRKGSIRFLVATDVVGRGIDVQHVSLVINLSLPSNRSDFIHRVGRSGRFGRKGVAINLVTADELVNLKEFAEHYNFKIQPLPREVITIFK